MWVVDKYIDYVKEQTIEDPKKSWGKILLGFQANKLRTKILPKKGLAKGYQKLEAMMMSFVADALSHSESYVWGNIFFALRDHPVFLGLEHCPSSAWPVT